MINTILSYFDEMKIKINPISLQFMDKELENNFSFTYNQDSLPMFKFAIVLTFFLFTFYGFLDQFTFPSNYKEIWLIRTFVDIFLVIIFLITLIKKNVIHLQKISATMILVAGVSLLYIYSHHTETDFVYIYLSSYALLIAGTFTVAGLKFFNALKVVILMDVFAIAVFYIKLNLISNLFFAMLFVSITCIVLVSSYFSEVLKRKLFLKDIASKKLLENLSYVNNQLDKQNDELKKNQMHMIQQARLASAGEMIGNIAHQWRQPLNTLGLINQKLSIYQKRGLLNDKKLEDSVNRSMTIINNMSSTIDDFRDFFNPKKEKVDFLLIDSIKNAYSIVEASLAHESISYKLSMQDENIQVSGYSNELSQVIVNLLNNAKDALSNIEITHKSISIVIDTSDKKIEIKVCDNGGGISDSNIDRIFEPYFTTKEEGKGTGVGLYMSRTIIEEHMGGRLTAKNHNGGACFIIELVDNSSNQ